MYKVVIKNGEIVGTPRQDFISDGDVIAGLEGVTVDDIQLVENEPFYNSKTGKFQLFNEEEYEQEQLIKAQQTKYAEITEKYDYANKYLILKVDDEQELYANVAWYQTWSKVMSLAQQLAPQSETTTIPSPVRFYKLTPDGKLYNKSVSDLDVTKLLEYFNKVQFAQFNVLQPKRDILYLQLAQAKTIEDIEAIEVDFGITLNEQDMADVTAKVDLTYVEQPVEEVTEDETDEVNSEVKTPDEGTTPDEDVEDSTTDSIEGDTEEVSPDIINGAGEAVVEVTDEEVPGND